MERITAGNFITDEKTDKVYISGLLENCSGFDKETASKLKSGIEGFSHVCGLLSNTKDVWARDYMPVQLTNDIFLSFTYKPDYLESCPQYVTNWQMHNVYAKGQGAFDFKVVNMPIILDGGNVVKAVVDDNPCIIMCDKVLRENNVSEQVFRDWWDRWWNENFDGTEMKLILLPWEGKELNPIGHADGMVRYIGDGRVLMTNYLDFDKMFNDEHGKEMKRILEEDYKINVVTLRFWDKFKDDKHFQHLINESWCYINYLQVGNRILMPSLGYDPLDEEAMRQIREALNKEVEIIGVDMTFVVRDPAHDENSGGALNCLTWTIRQLKAKADVGNNL